MRVMASKASSHWSRFSSRGMTNPPSSASDEDSPVPNSTRPSDTKSRVLTRSTTRAGWLKLNGIWTMPWPRRMRLVRCGAEDLRRRGVAVLLEEVVLDLPDAVHASLVGELDLLEGVLEQLVLGVG